MKKIFLGSIASALLLWCAFPQLSFFWCAWFGFVPLLYVIEHQHPRTAFFATYLCGFVFFLLVISWLIQVTFFGYLWLCAYCALYVGIFGFLVNFFRQRTSASVIQRIFLFAALWVLLEYLRSTIASGFPWALLAHSQAVAPIFIQSADITGTYGISFFVMVLNVGIYELLRARYEPVRVSTKKCAMMLVCFVLVVVGYGVVRPRILLKRQTPLLRVAMVQGNIPQDLHQPLMLPAAIKARYRRLTQQVLTAEPDLIIWPESAFPDYIFEEEPRTSVSMKSLAYVIQTPLLFGTVYHAGRDYFNSAVLIPGYRQTWQRYDKIHLVPFGEYVPFRKAFFFLQHILPAEDFSPGRQLTVFHLEGSHQQPVYFGTVICFEDTVAWIARELRLQGAQFLVNMTNDAWFQNSAAPYQHMAASVVRAVENRMYVVRAANTGISCIIDYTGCVTERVCDNTGSDLEVEGTAVGELFYPHTGLSFYTQFGDVFILLCALYTLIVSVRVCCVRRRVR